MTAEIKSKAIFYATRSTDNEYSYSKFRGNATFGTLLNKPDRIYIEGTSAHPKIEVFFYDGVLEDEVEVHIEHMNNSNKVVRPTKNKHPNRKSSNKVVRPTKSKSSSKVVRPTLSMHETHFWCYRTLGKDKDNDGSSSDDVPLAQRVPKVDGDGDGKKPQKKKKKKKATEQGGAANLTHARNSLFSMIGDNVAANEEEAPEEQAIQSLTASIFHLRDIKEMAEKLKESKTNKNIQNKEDVFRELDEIIEKCGSGQQQAQQLCTLFKKLEEVQEHVNDESDDDETISNSANYKLPDEEAETNFKNAKGKLLQVANEITTYELGVSDTHTKELEKIVNRAKNDGMQRDEKITLTNDIMELVKCLREYVKEELKQIEKQLQEAAQQQLKTKEGLDRLDKKRQNTTT